MLYKGSSDVFRSVGDSVQLDTQRPVPEFDDLSWISNGNINVLKYFNEPKRTHHPPAYEGRVEFNERTYSLTLKNLQKTDSGLYVARTSNHEVTVVAEYRLSVLDPVEDPVLTHQVNTDTCNITLTCRGHDLSFNSSCYKKTCEEKNETSPGGVTLSLSVRGSSIICNHSNPASWKIKTLDMGELTRPCTDGRKGEHSAPGDDSKSTGVVVSIVGPVAVVTIIIISIFVYKYWRRSRGVSEELLYSSVPGVSGNTQCEETVYAAVEDPHRVCGWWIILSTALWLSCGGPVPLKNWVIQYTEKQMDYSLDLYTYRVSCMTTSPATVEMSTVYSVVQKVPQCTSNGESGQTPPDPENE
ncbi:hypothetical protein NFI96_032663 [Prochilodus magdalenae]|nr:hypothetical protein NFI96_032663 [Prochilodus magdalenae]